MLGLHSWHFAPWDHFWEPFLKLAPPHAEVKAQMLTASPSSHPQVRSSIATDPTSLSNTSLRLTSMKGRSSTGHPEPPRTCRSSINTPSSVRSHCESGTDNYFNSWYLDSLHRSLISVWIVDFWLTFRGVTFSCGECDKWPLKSKSWPFRDKIPSQFVWIFGNSAALNHLQLFFCSTVCIFAAVPPQLPIFVFFVLSPSHRAKNVCLFYPHRSARVTECLFHRYVFHLSQLGGRWEDEEQDGALSIPRTHTPLLQILSCLQPHFQCLPLCNFGQNICLGFLNLLPFSTFFLYSFLIFFLPSTLFFTQPAISPPFLSFDFIFFPFKILCNLSFLALWCSFSSAIVISSPFSLSCFYLLHIKSFQSFHLLHSCTFQPAGCFRKLCNHSSCDHAFILFLLSSLLFCIFLILLTLFAFMFLPVLCASVSDGEHITPEMDFAVLLLSNHQQPPVFQVLDPVLEVIMGGQVPIGKRRTHMFHEN